MLVFRVMEDVHYYTGDYKRVNEYEDYIKGIISEPKTTFNDGFNTHKYKSGVKYLHFFHYYEGAIEYVTGIPFMGWDGRCYIAAYDIPDDLLDKYRGLGIYPRIIHSDIPVLEYAIPYEKLDNEFIVGSLRKYELSEDYSEEYLRYMQGEYQKYIDSLDDTNKQFVKAVLKTYKRDVH